MGELLKLVGLTLFGYSALSSAHLSWNPRQTYALIVGVTEWKYKQLASFSKVGRKDRALRDVLLLNGIPSNQIVFLEDGEATLSNIEGALDLLLRRAPEDSHFIFYFQGHGARRGNEVILANFDADTRKLQATGLGTTRLRNIFERKFRGKSLLFLGDFCYSGSLVRLTEEFRKETRFNSAALASSYRSASSTLAWDFTEALIDIFSGSPRADKNGDGAITLAEAIEYIEETMRSRALQLAEGGASPRSSPESFVLARTLFTSQPTPGRIGSFHARRLVEAYIDGRWEMARLENFTGGLYQVVARGKIYSVRESQIRSFATTAFPIGTECWAWFIPLNQTDFRGMQGRVVESRRDFRRIEFGHPFATFGSEWYHVSDLTLEGEVEDD